MPAPHASTAEIDPSSRVYARGLALAMLSAWALNLYFYAGYYMSDDGSYLSGIQEIAGLHAIDPSNVALTRLLAITPAALVYAASGSLLLTIASYTLYHPLLVGAVYWAGCLAFKRKTALLAAVLVALSPVYYTFGGAILPDNSLCLWLALLLGALLWVLRDQQRAHGSERRELALWWGVGLLNGLAYSAKEPGLVVAAPVGLAIVIVRLQQGARWRALRAGLAYGVGLLSFLLLECVALRIASGSWVFRLTAGMGSTGNMTALVGRVQQQGITPAARLAFWFRSNHEYFAPLVPVVLAGSLLAPWLARRRLLEARGSVLAILVAFWVWPFVYLTFGTTSLRHYVPPPLQHARYFSVCVAPALLLSAAVGVQLFEQLRERVPEARAALRRALAAMPYALALLWGLVQFVDFEPGAGVLYRAATTKSALAAFQDARRLQPQLPVVLSSQLGGRLDPLLHSPGCSACEHIISQVDALEQAPPRPFVALILAKNRRDSLGPVLTRLQKKRQIELQPLGQGVYRAPAGRRAELRSALYPLLGEFSEPGGPRAEPNEAVALYLVTDVVR